jgi:hypothetical protein
MPVHDWTRVDAGTFHAFHTSWLTHLMGALNGGLLPHGYYALSEQVATRMQTDVLTLRAPLPGPLHPQGTHPGGVAVTESPPQVRLSVRPDPTRKPRRPVRRGRHLVIRHISGHQVVALIEITSPANKDRRAHVHELADKIVRSLESGVHVLLLDVLPPGPHDPHGMHGAVWSYFDRASYEPPDDAPLTLASYAWDGEEPRAYVEPLAVGQALVEMPLFLSAERYVNVPLEPTYQEAYQDMPEFWRNVIEQGRPPAEPSA